VRVEHVPDDLGDEAVRRHIESVAGPVAATAPEREARPGQRTLLVQLYTPEACERALRSPKAVCDNRFIFVKRALGNVADPASLPPPPPGSGGPTGGGSSFGKGKGKGKGSGKGNKGGKGAAGGDADTVQADGAATAEEAAAAAARLAAAEALSGDEQLRLKQERAAELKASAEALRAQTRATWEKQLADARSMRTSLAKQAAKVAPVVVPIGGGGGEGEVASSSSKGSNKAAALLALVEAKIAKLEAQLADPTAFDQQMAAAASPPAAANQQHSSPPPAAKRANIDNRPTAFTVAAVPSGFDQQDLEGHFSAYGDLVRVEVVPPPVGSDQSTSPSFSSSTSSSSLPSAVVHFAQRYSAESAFKRARSLGGVPLQFAWVATAPAAASPTAAEASPSEADVGPTAPGVAVPASDSGPFSAMKNEL
jgi:hypothetical protein